MIKLRSVYVRISLKIKVAEEGRGKEGLERLCLWDIFFNLLLESFTLGSNISCFPSFITTPKNFLDTTYLYMGILGSFLLRLPWLSYLKTRKLQTDFENKRNDSKTRYGRVQVANFTFKHTHQPKHTLTYLYDWLSLVEAGNVDHAEAVHIAAAAEAGLVLDFGSWSEIE